MLNWGPAWEFFVLLHVEFWGGFGFQDFFCNDETPSLLMTWWLQHGLLQLISSSFKNIYSKFQGSKQQFMWLIRHWSYPRVKTEGMGKREWDEVAQWNISGQAGPLGAVLSSLG